MKRLITDTYKGKTRVFTDSTIYRNYLEYCEYHDFTPIPEETALIFIHDYADLGYSATSIYKELCKLKFEDSCYTCPFYEGETRTGQPICCYVSSCKGTRDLIAVVPHKEIKKFLQQVKQSDIGKVHEVSVIVKGKQYIKVYKSKAPE